MLARVLRVLLLSLLSLSALAHVQTTQLTATAKQFDQHLTSLTEIEGRIEQSQQTLLSPYQARYRILKISSSTKKKLEKMQAQAAEQQRLLDALGPPPDKGSLDHSLLAHQRSTYQHTLNNYKLQIREAHAIIATAQTLLDTLHQQQIALKLKRLKQRTHPLYLPSSLLVIQQQTLAFLETTTSSLIGLELKLAKALQSPLSWFGLGLLIFLLYALLVPIRQQIHQHWPTQSPKSPAHTQATSAVIGLIMRQALIPFCALFFVAITMHLNGLLSPTQSLAVYASCIALGSIWLLRGFIKGNLAVKHPKWRTWPYSDAVALALQPRLIQWASLAITASWLLALSQLALAPKHLIHFVQAITFTLLGFTSLSLLSDHFWKAARDQVKPSASRRLLRLLVAVLTSIMPIASIAGYHTLANTLFRNLALSLLVLGSLRYLNLSFRQAIDSVLANWQPRLNPNTPDLEDKVTRKREYAAYWYGLAVGTLLCCFGLILLMLVWGTNIDTLIDWGRLVLFGDPTSQHSQLTLINVLIGIGIFLLIYTATKAFQRILDSRVFPNTELDTGAQHALLTGTGYLGVGIGILSGFSAIGFNLSSLLWIAGGLSVGIGLGLQPIITNFVSGLIMLIERPVKVGDILTVEGQKGRITDINVRATVLRTFQRNEILIPNSQMITHTVHNWSHHDDLQRVEINIGVAYGSDTDKVRELLFECAAANRTVLTTPKPMVRFMNFGASSLDFQLRVFVHGSTGVASELRFEIDKRFREAGIEIPFPQQDIRIINDSDDS